MNQSDWHDSHEVYVTGGLQIWIGEEFLKCLELKVEVSRDSDIRR